MAPSIFASSRSRVGENSMPISKPPLHDLFHLLVVPEHDQRAGAPAEDPFQPVAQLGSRSYTGQGRLEGVLGTLDHVGVSLGQAGMGAGPPSGQPQAP